MSLHKLCCFTMLATIVVSEAVGGLNDHTKKFDVAKSMQFGRARAGQSLAWYDGQPSQRSKQITLGTWRQPQKITPAVFVPIQSKDVDDLHVGKLLVASRGLADPNFAKTVILLIQSDDQGFVGLILNRRTDVPLSRVLEGFQGAKDRSDRAYLGGPVELPAIFALIKSSLKVDGAEHIFGGVYLVRTKAVFEKTLAAGPDPQGFHVYLGYAGWTKEQLQKEVELGAWFIFSPDSGAVFTPDPSSLWLQMIRKTELQFAKGAPAGADRRELSFFINNQYHDADTNKGFWFGDPTGRDARTYEARSISRAMGPAGGSQVTTRIRLVYFNEHWTAKACHCSMFGLVGEGPECKRILFLGRPECGP